MKEITRIHIAKTAYDIELPAKKDLEAYLKMLEAYSRDTEILEDIEIRITEILADRNIKKGGVISLADITALKQQLGEPREFMTDGDIAVGEENEKALADEPVRKLYRNTDSAVIGGVLSGIASFFKIDPIWVRLAFIVLLFASFGTALLVYVVLWVAVPAARTAADKLQMAGRAVTVGSIREINENEASKPSSTGNESAKRAFSIIGGITSIIFATGAAMVTTFAIVAITFGGQRHVLTETGNDSGFFIAAFVLAAISGLLLTALFILCAYASFTQKMTKRVLVSICAVIVLGLVSFGGAIGLAQYGGIQRSQAIQANTRETTITLPNGVESVKSLIVNDAQNMNVTYVVTNEKPSATLRTVLQDDVIVPTPKVTIDKDVLKIDAAKISDRTCESAWWCDRSRQELIVRGPALSNITANQSANIDYAAKDQDLLAVVAEQNANVIVSSGTIKSLIATAREEASIRATSATVQSLGADVRMSAQIEAGTVQTLTVTDLKSCPSRTREARIGIADVTTGTMTLNGASHPVESLDTGCTEIEIEREANE